MSPVNRAGSVSEISPRHSFACKNMRGRAGPVTEISVFATDISVTGMKISHMNTPARSPGRNFLNKIASLSQHIVQNGIILVLYVFPLRSMRIIFISKVTRFHKAVTVANNTNLCSTILVVFLEFTSVDRAEISHMNTPHNSSR